MDAIAYTWKEWLRAQQKSDHLGVHCNISNHHWRQKNPEYVPIQAFPPRLT